MLTKFSFHTQNSNFLTLLRMQRHLAGKLSISNLHIVGGLLQVVVVMAAHLMGGQEGSTLPKQLIIQHSRQHLVPDQPKNC